MLLRTIELYLEMTGTAPSRFGRDAVGDARLVHDLRRGRRLRPATALRLSAYLAARAGQA